MKRLLTLLAAASLTLLLLPVHTSSAEEAPEPDTNELQNGFSAAELATVHPVMVVLDVSGSMADEDGAGTVKLAAAQTELSKLVRTMHPDDQLGLWSYPGDLDCDPGQAVIPPDRVDQEEMIKKIRSLTAEGNTPTGEALRAAVDELKSKGHAGATLLLVSDGESNCAPPPCEVAEEIVEEGFDITVHGAGFEISEAGMAELTCIANATGGTVTEVENAEEIGEVIASTTSSHLDVEVSGMPSQVHAGGASRVTVTMTNTGNRLIPDAQLYFTFAEDHDGESLVPPVLPPRKAFGNIAPGQSVQHTWLIGFGSPEMSGTANWSVVGWGDMTQPVKRTGTVLVNDSDQTLHDGGPLLEQLSGERIAILGDSYSSGEGTGDYLTETGPDDVLCHRSVQTYMAPLFAADDVHVLACSGATSSVDVQARDDEGTRSNGVLEDQVLALADLQAETGPVAAAFLTVGGTDLEFTKLIEACVLGTSKAETDRLDADPATRNHHCSENPELTHNTHDMMSGLRSDLAEAYTTTYDTLNTSAAHDERGGVAPLYVLAYPQLFPERDRVNAWCPNLHPSEVDWANTLVGQLNSAIDDSVQSLRGQGYRIHMVRATQESFLPHNTMCGRSGFESYVEQELLHPNAAGYRAETNTVVTWSVDVDDDADEQDWRHSADCSPWALWDACGRAELTAKLDELTAPPGRTVEVSYDASTGAYSPAEFDARAGDEVRVVVSNAEPESSVRVSLASRTRMLGSLTADEEGRATGLVLIPRDVPQGTHPFTTAAFDTDGRPTVGSTHVDVSEAVPWWTLPVGAGALLALLLGVALGWRARRNERVAEEHAVA